MSLLKKVSSITLAERRQLILNGGFEVAGGGGADVFADWIEEGVGTGTLVNETVLVHSGGHACKINAGNVPDWRPRVAQNFVAIPGKNYTLSFWTRGDGVGAGWITVYDITNAANIIWQTTGVIGVVYQKVIVPFTAPAGCISIDINLQATWGVVGTVSYFDDVTILEL